MTDRLAASLQVRGQTSAVLSFVLVGAALAYLSFKLIALAAEPGYDFRYLWVAGKMWAEGVSPYDAAYQQVGAAAISSGHVPLKWVYPPSWWVIVTPLGLLDLKSANLVWNGINIVLTLAASVLLALAYKRTFPDQRLPTPLLNALFQHVSTLAALHVFFMAALEATAIVMSVGQTSTVIYFGVAALLYGLSGGGRAWAVAGLALVFLKPQIGLVFGVVLLFQGRDLRRQVIVAGFLSLALAAPALLSDPMAPLAFVQNVAAYDGMTIANLPQAMTGLRLLVWEGFETDLGNTAALLITLALALVLSLGPLRPAPEAAPSVRAWQLVAIIVALIVSLGPLHYYDFVLVGVLVFPMLAAGPLFQLLALVGTAMILRADQVGAATGLYDPKVGIFEGSLLSTWGALLILPAIWSAASAWRARDLPRPA